MSVRTTTEKVLEILDTDITDCTPFIVAANLIVDEQLSEEGLSEALLTEIERWLAAHLACAKDPYIKAQKLGDASATYSGDFGKGLESTPYGQQVSLLDPTGSLARMGAKKVSFAAIDFDVGE